MPAICIVFAHMLHTDDACASTLRQKTRIQRFDWWFLMRFQTALALLLVSLPALADTSIRNQFSGIQRIDAPDGSVLSETRVFVDGRQLRLEFSQREGTRATLQGVLIRQESGEVFLLNSERKDAMRIDPSRPIHHLSPEFLMLALLVDDKLGESPMVREMIRQEQVANRVLDVLRVLLGPDLTALLFVDQLTRLPVRVELGPRTGGPRADWNNVAGGAQPPHLFVVPPEFKVRTSPDAGR